MDGITSGLAGVHKDNHTYAPIGPDIHVDVLNNTVDPTGGATTEEGGAKSFSVQTFHDCLVFVICCCGTLGNILSIAVLTRQRVRRTVTSNETIVYYGLVLLSGADLLFCLTFLPRPLVTGSSVFEGRSLTMFYQLYCTGLVTTFSLISTWLIVVTAALRYLGICHPLRSRYLLNSRVVGVTLFHVIFICVLVNLPSFWLLKVVNLGGAESVELSGEGESIGYTGEGKGVESVEGTNSIGQQGTVERGSLYMIDLGEFSHEKNHGIVYLWLRAGVGVFLPFGLLLFFNSRLIRALKQSEKFRLQSSSEPVRGKLSRKYTCTGSMDLSSTGTRGNTLHESTNYHQQNLQSQHLTGRHYSSHRLSAKNRLTTILIFIVVFFVLLVFPGEMMDFVLHLPGLFRPNPEIFMAARLVTNVLQVSNFSFNFLLYCALNARFRSTLRRLCCCGARSAGVRCVRLRPLPREGVQVTMGGGGVGGGSCCVRCEVDDIEVCGEESDSGRDRYNLSVIKRYNSASNVAGRDRRRGLQSREEGLCLSHPAYQPTVQSTRRIRKLQIEDSDFPTSYVYER